VQHPEPSQQNNNFPTFGTIHTITGGSNLDFQNKRQKQEGPITRTKWSHIPLTFTEADIKLVSFPHIDAMVITAHIDKCDVTRVLINDGNQAEIVFLSAFNHMGFDRKQLKEATKPLYGFGGKRIEPLGSISLTVSFESLQNASTEYVTFNLVDMHYLYNAIFGKGLLNAFEATLHSAYVCLKVPALLGVISIHDSQKDARNIEQGFAPTHRNVNCLQEEEAEGRHDTSTPKSKASIVSKPAINQECEIKRVSLDPRVLDKTVMIS
jgi:hypothetical protein